DALTAARHRARSGEPGGAPAAGRAMKSRRGARNAEYRVLSTEYPVPRRRQNGVASSGLTVVSSRVSFSSRVGSLALVSIGCSWWPAIGRRRLRVDNFKAKLQ